MIIIIITFVHLLCIFLKSSTEIFTYIAHIVSNIIMLAYAHPPLKLATMNYCLPPSFVSSIVTGKQIP